MTDISSLSGQMTVNGTDLYDTYGVFLTEDKPGDMENLKAILTPAALKTQTGVNIDTQPGRRYSDSLDLQQDEREFTLYFAQYAASKEQWFANYKAFLAFLRTGYDDDHKGWLHMAFPTLGVTMTVFVTAYPSFTPLTHLWKSGIQAGKYKIKFKEPVPSF